MKLNTDNQKKILSLSRSYQSELVKHLSRGRDSASEPGVTRKLGDRLMKLGVDLLGLAKIHVNALDALAKDGRLTQTDEDQIRHSTTFFNLVGVPIEESRFTVSEANHRLYAIIETLTSRTEELDRSNQKLLSEIARRKKSEESLRTSEETASELLKKAREMQEKMRSLSRRLITAQESERKRISRELHDVIAQTLAGINLRLAVLRSQTTANAEDFHEKIESTERLVAESVDIVHRFATDLRPVVLDDIGLVPALRAYLDSFTEQYGIPVGLIASSEVEELDNDALTTLFRIAQEALTNIGRYSKANLVKFDLRPTKRNSFRMKIVDDGEGFEMTGATPTHESDRLGILGMRERAEMVGGSFRIESAVGEGTVIRVEIPRHAIDQKPPTPII